MAFPTPHETLVGRLNLARTRLTLMGPPARDMTTGDFARRAALEQTIVDLEAELATQLALPGFADVPDVDSPHGIDELALFTVDEMEAALRPADWPEAETA